MILHRLRIILFCAACVALVGIVSQTSHRVGSTAITHASTSAEQYIYFEPANVASARRLHFVPELGQPGQVIVVSTATDLQSAVAAHQPPAIWIHADARNLVPQAWLRDQAARGTVIVGVEMTERDLADMLGLDPQTHGSTWRPNDGRPSYVVYYQAQADVQQPDGRVSHVSGSGTINNPYDPNNPAEIFAATRVTIQKVRSIGQAITPPPTPTNSR